MQGRWVGRSDIFKKSKIQGANSKNLSRLAYPKSKILLSFNTKRNSPLTTKNKMMAIYPVSPLKNCRYSFLQILYIVGIKLMQFKLKGYINKKTTRLKHLVVFEVCT
jgi:hypothetical protein